LTPIKSFLKVAVIFFVLSIVTFTGLDESLSMSPVHPTNDHPLDGIARISIILP